MATRKFKIGDKAIVNCKNWRFPMGTKTSVIGVGWDWYGRLQYNVEDLNGNTYWYYSYQLKKAEKILKVI